MSLLSLGARRHSPRMASPSPAACGRTAMKRTIYWGEPQTMQQDPIIPPGASPRARRLGDPIAYQGFERCLMDRLNQSETN